MIVAETEYNKEGEYVYQLAPGSIHWLTLNAMAKEAGTCYSTIKGRISQGKHPYEAIAMGPPRTERLRYWKGDKDNKPRKYNIKELAKIKGMEIPAMRYRVSRHGTEMAMTMTRSELMLLKNPRKVSTKIVIRPEWGKYKTYHQDAKEATRIRHLLNDMSTGSWESENL